jgi:hypothetical protein
LVDHHEEWLSGPHEFTVLTVVPRFRPMPHRCSPPEQLKSYYDDTADAHLQADPQVHSQTRHEPPNYVAKVGHAPEVIAKMADKGKHDMIMMGSHGHGNLLNLITGSVATKVMAGCKTPVLLVR